MIGALPAARYSAACVDVPPAARLYLFSDGAFETTAPDGRDHGLDDLLPLLDAGAAAPLRGEAERAYRAVRARSRPGPLADDCSLLVVDFA
jgi:sigma-B regulation protein RsbU (phosphoserine phosphatase)